MTQQSTAFLKKISKASLTFFILAAATTTQARYIHQKTNTILWPQSGFKTQDSGQNDSQSGITANTKLLYYGGQVISQVKGFTVFWTDKVDSQTQSKITNFYSDYVQSYNMDWLNEYATNIKAIDGRQGTAQTIGRGQWLGQAVISPNLTSKNIQDTQIQKEIEDQIEKGVLPIPDSNTLYMLHFPRGYQIVIDGMTSCFSFGGYHFNFKSQKYGDIFYGVMPDCSFAGSSGSSFSSMTTVSSHELMEAITDPMPTPGSSPAYPQAWNTASGEEISDICDGYSYNFEAPTGKYTITNNWSNSRNKCFNGVQ